jgi:hypothetical protein
MAIADSGFAPRPTTRSADDVLRELRIYSSPPDEQRQVIAENLWRLRPEEIGWLHGAGLTSLTREAAEKMAEGMPERMAREAAAVEAGEHFE